MSGWQNHPFQIQAKAGETQYFCRCGLTKNGPHCDGSHQGTEVTPFEVTPDSQSKTSKEIRCAI